MDRQERNLHYQNALNKWGVDAQLDHFIEEMAELIVAINKYKRLKHFDQKRDGVMENIYEELADVKMCLEQMEIFFGKDKIDETLNQKMQKFIKFINN